jgi:hypothetical protein
LIIRYLEIYRLAPADSRTLVLFGRFTTLFISLFIRKTSSKCVSRPRNSDHFKKLPVLSFGRMANFFNRAKSMMSAPKTEDPKYDQARAVFKSHKLDVPKYVGAAKNLARSCHDLSTACKKFADDASLWSREFQAPTADQADLVASNSAEWHRASEQLQWLVDPNFVVPLTGYGQKVTVLHKLKEARRDAMSKYDEQREFYRLCQNSKGAKPGELEKAKASTEDLEAKYVTANKDFIKAVVHHATERRTTLEEPFRNFSAILCAYFRRMEGGPVPPVRPAATMPLSRPAPMPSVVPVSVPPARPTAMAATTPAATAAAGPPGRPVPMKQPGPQGGELARFPSAEELKANPLYKQRQLLN